MKNYKKYIIVTTIVFSLPFVILSTIWLSAYCREKFQDERIAILLYHQLTPYKTEANYYHLPVQEFRRQLLWLKQNKFVITDLYVFKHKISYPKEYKLIILTFDDGTHDHFLYAFPILKKFGFKGTFLLLHHILTKPYQNQR